MVASNAPGSKPSPGPLPPNGPRRATTASAVTTAKFLSEFNDALIGEDIANEVIVDILIAVAPIALELVSKGILHAD